MNPGRDQASTSLVCVCCQQCSQSKNFVPNIWEELSACLPIHTQLNFTGITEVKPEKGVLPYMAYMGTCHWTGYDFSPLCPEPGVVA